MSGEQGRGESREERNGAGSGGTASAPMAAEPAARSAPAAEVAAVLTLLRATDLGSRSVARLLGLFDSARAVLSADDSTLEAVGGLTPETVRALREAQGAGFGERELERAERLGARVLLPGEPEYPPLLRRTGSPPAALYVLGKRLPEDNRVVGVVGRRRAGEAGKEMAHQIGAGLAKAGVVVVSGMAYGIDAAAHRGALQERGHTVAVLGCGVDQVYPSRHRGLYEEILREGTLVSELFLGAGPEARNFPMRNRIIAGMALGTIVVEAPAKSGALITANYALQENRQVFAVPGHPLSPGYEGCNFLLRQGATPIRHAGDVLEDLGPQMGLSRPGEGQDTLDLNAVPEGLSEEERRLYEMLDTVEPLHADRIAMDLKLDTSRLGVLLLQLELKGVIHRIPGDRYLRRPVRGGGV